MTSWVTNIWYVKWPKIYQKWYAWGEAGFWKSIEIICEVPRGSALAYESRGRGLELYLGHFHSHKLSWLKRYVDNWWKIDWNKKAQTIFKLVKHILYTFGWRGTLETAKHDNYCSFVCDTFRVVRYKENENGTEISQ